MTPASRSSVPPTVVWSLQNPNQLLQTNFSPRRPVAAPAIEDPASAPGKAVPVQATPARELSRLTKFFLSSISPPVLKPASQSAVLFISASVLAVGGALFYGGKETAGSAANPDHGRKATVTKSHLAGKFVKSSGNSAGISSSEAAGRAEETHAQYTREPVGELAAVPQTGPRGALSVGESVPHTAAGARLHTAGQSVTVESFTPLSGQPGPALTIVISPLPVPAPVAPSPLGGFSHEDELFRTKWGWAAHEAVRRAAQEEQTIH